MDVQKPELIIMIVVISVVLYLTSKDEYTVLYKISKGVCVKNIKKIIT